MAKPLVETLQLKKDKERNPRIRETQMFQEFEQAVKDKDKVHILNSVGSFSYVHSKASSDGAPSSTAHFSWSVSLAIGTSVFFKSFSRLEQDEDEQTESGCRSCWKSFELRFIAPIFTR